ncbi:MAG: PAS domain S-box protein [Xanthobacteraceae bacterium]
MNNAEFQLRGIHDARLAVHATGASPAWLWTPDGTRILWANPVGIALLGAADGAALAARSFGPADQQRRQIAQLAARLSPATPPRLERLRGFGAPLGSLVTCICTRLQFADGDSGILIVAAEIVGRTIPLEERLRRVVETVDMPMAAFTHDGRVAGVSQTARSLLGSRDLTHADLVQARDDALKTGHAEATIDIGHVVLQRIGSGDHIGLIATLTPAIMPTAIPPLHFTPHVPAGTPPAIPVVETAASDQVATTDESVATQPPPPPAADPAPHDDDAAVPSPTAASLPATVQPIRFVWQMDADGRFLLGSDEFMRLIGVHTASAFGRPWHEIVEALDLDPHGLVEKAVATHETWSGITLQWPVDDPGTRLPVELSGLPVFDRARDFAGYRGFGVCRDLARLNELATQQHATPMRHLPIPRPLAADVPHAPATDATPTPPSAEQVPSPAETPLSSPTDPDAILDNVLENSQNVVQFRPTPDAKQPTLTPVENSAFHELARQLSARLENEMGETDAVTPDNDDVVTATDAPAAVPEAEHNDSADVSSCPLTPPRGEATRDVPLFDLMPSGVLIYRLERLLYVNRAFLARAGFDNLEALHDAGGLDALYIDPADAVASSVIDAGTPVTITTQNASVPPLQAHLSTITWDGETALALILTETVAAQAVAPSAAEVPPPPASGQVNAEELAAILDITAEGVMMFDASGKISVCNRSAEALFGMTGDELTQRTLSELFAPESENAVRDYFASIASAEAASLLDHGREVLGRVRGGGFLPLAMTMGRTLPGSPNFFAVFRDLTQSKQNEAAQLLARRQTERAASAKADVLARVSHEIRTPLNAIIGFADVMIDERFGSLGHERYAEYLKDIRASGERVSAIVDEMLDLSRIETGKLDLAFGRHNLNDLLEQCVAVMQPRANRERIIIRTSLAHTLPSIVADARTLRQITLNLIGNSIHLANAGGQVIVSTALSDEGDVVLRVRDTGNGMNDNELAAAVEPFGTPMPDQTPGHVGVSLALTKALVEANRARFQLKSVSRSGTLIEVTFPQATTAA